MSSDTQTPTPHHLPRRTVAAGAVWAIPAVAIAGAAPAYASSQTTKPPCVGDIAAVGGTYPVDYNLSGCTPNGTHWDFRFDITASKRTGTDCDCDDFRVTLFDNPTRSRLWIYGRENDFVNWSTSTAKSPRLFVQKVLTPGATGRFPDTGDNVRRVSGSSPYDGFVTTGTTANVGNITADGTPNDTVHVLFNANGIGVPCATNPVLASGPMAYYKIECGKKVGANTTYTQLGGIGEIEPCIPMIQSTVCRSSTTNNGTYRLGISVLTSCGLAASKFEITNVQRNNDSDTPTAGSSVWSGSEFLGAVPKNITTDASSESGNYLWISFTTDGGVNTSRIRVGTNTNTCGAGLAAQSEEQPAEAPAATESGAATEESSVTESSVTESVEPSVTESASPEPTEQ